MDLQTVQVLDDTVVVHDGQFIFREENGQEVVELLFPRISRILLPALLADTDGRRTAVVAVRDVDAFDAPEGVLDGLTIGLITDDPDPVPDISFRDKITDRCGCTVFFHDLRDLIVPAVAQEDRSCLGATGVDMTDPVLFLVSARVFVLLDDIVFVVIDGGTCDQTGLGAAVHGLRVHVIAGGPVLDEAAVTDPAVEQAGCMRVDLFIVEIHLFGKGRLGPVDGQKGAGVFSDIGAGFCAGVDVIGQSGNLRLQPPGGAHGAKRANIGHKNLLKFLTLFNQQLKNGFHASEPVKATDKSFKK